MDMKQRTLARLLGLCVLAGAALAGLTLHTNRQAAAQSGIPLVELGDALDILTLERGGQTLTLAYTESGWALREDEAYHLDQSACEALGAAFCGLHASRQLAGAEGEDYGLDTPQAIVTATGGGQSVRLCIGAENPMTGDCYLQREGDTALYTVDSADLAVFLTDKAALFGSFCPAGVTRADIEAVQITLADGSTVSLRAVSQPVQDADPETGVSYQSVWRLDAEPEAELDEAALDALLNGLCCYATAQHTGADPADYGFDAPLAEVRMTTAGGTVTLRYASGMDGTYLMCEGDNSIYALDLSAVQAVCADAQQLKKAQ